MILFITKKVTVIFKVNNTLITLFLCWINVRVAFADSYCFEKTVNLKNAKNSIDFLLLPNDVVDFQTDENCIDITVSPDRGKLFEKYLSKRYALLSTSRKGEVSSVVDSANCVLDFKTTTKTNSEGNTVKLGQKNSANKASSTFINESTMQILLSSGLQGELEVGTQKLKIMCRLIGESTANLIFSFADVGHGSVKTEILVKRGEWLNIASVVKELNENNKNLGIPQTDINELNGKTEIRYELKLQ